MSPSSGRSQLGWSVPAQDWERFETYVREKWGDDGAHVRFELEKAMEEFIERDGDLAEAESLLQEAVGLSELSSSTEETITRDVSPENKRQVGYRVREVLKDEFTTFVAEEFNDGTSGRYGGLSDSHVSYGEALAAAINEYRDGGRGRRVRELVEATITGATDSGRENDSVESKSGTDEELSTAPDLSTTAGESEAGSADDLPDVEPRLVLSVADELGEQFTERDLRKTVVQHLNAEYDEFPGKLIEEYSEAALDQLAVVQHPSKEELYISESMREEITVWSDLNKDLRAARLRRLVAADALDAGKTRHPVGYRDVIELFKENLDDGPSVQYAYDLMDAAADGAEGFVYKKIRGEKQLRVDLTKVNRSVLEDTPNVVAWLTPEDVPGQGATADSVSNTAAPVADGGTPVDDRHLTED